MGTAIFPAAGALLSVPAVPGSAQACDIATRKPQALEVGMRTGGHYEHEARA